MFRSLKDVFRRFPSRSWLIALLIVSVGMVCTVMAQLGNFEDLLDGKLAPKRSSKAEFTATLTPSTAKPGDEVTLTVAAKLPPQSYIYATTGDFEGRTQITTTNVVGLEEVDTAFKPDRDPETKMDETFKQEISKFHGDVTWSKKFRLKEGTEADKVAIDLQLEGQYCSEGPGGQCTPIRPPAKLHAVLTVPFQYTERPIKGKDNPAEFHYQLAPTKSSSGKIVKLAVTMKIDEGWHTFPTTFKGEGGFPTTFELKKTYGLKPVGEDFKPDRQPETKDSDGLTLEIYHDKVTWIQEFEVLPDSRPNRLRCRGINQVPGL